MIVPLWRSTTMRRAMSRPRLVPLPASLVVYKASNARAATCGGMPGPLSRTLMTRWPFSARVASQRVLVPHVQRDRAIGVRRGSAAHG